MNWLSWEWYISTDFFTSKGRSNIIVSENFNIIENEININDGSDSTGMSLTSGGSGNKPNIPSKIRYNICICNTRLFIYNAKLFEVISIQFGWWISDENGSKNAKFWDITASYTCGQAIKPDKYFAGNAFQKSATKVCNVEREVTMEFVRKYADLVEHIHFVIYVILLQIYVYLFTCTN